MSGTASKRKGSQFERDLVRELRARGWDAERAYGAGRPDDVGDIAGLPVVVEAKACKRFDLAGWCDEAEVEAENAGVEIGVVIAKAPRRPTEDAYVVMRLPAFDILLRAAECGNPAGRGAL